MEDTLSPFWKKVFALGAFFVGCILFFNDRIVGAPLPATLPTIIVYAVKVGWWFGVGLLLLHSALRWPTWVRNLLVCVYIVAFMATCIAQLGIVLRWWP